MNSFHTTHIGPHFFDENKKLKYKKPSQNILKKQPQKEEVCSCPLCSGNQFLVVGKLSIDEMIDVWVKRANFNPIADVYRHNYLEKRRCLNCGLYFYNYHLVDNNELYENIMKAVFYYTQFRWEYGAASEYLEKLKPNSLIEIGSGTGNFLERVRYMIPKIVASEYNQAATKICQQKAIETTSADISTLQEKFDVVCAFEVLEHVWDNDTFMRNCLNLLNNNGTLLFGVPDPEGMLTINGNGWLNLPPHHQFDFSYQAFEYLAKKYKLKIVEYKKSELDYRHYEKYVENITGSKLTAPDILGYLETKKQFTGHSHFIVFEKK